MRRGAGGEAAWAGRMGEASGGCEQAAPGEVGRADRCAPVDDRVGRRGAASWLRLDLGRPAKRKGGTLGVTQRKKEEKKEKRKRIFQGFK